MGKPPGSREPRPECRRENNMKLLQQLLKGFADAWREFHEARINTDVETVIGEYEQEREHIANAIAALCARDEYLGERLQVLRRHKRMNTPSNHETSEQVS
jgi:hypothetical protein